MNDFWDIRLSNNAEKFLKKLKFKDDINRLLNGLNELKNGPFVRHYKKLEGTENKYRIRVGDYRMTYETDENLKIIFVLDIGLRKNIYD